MRHTRTKLSPTAFSTVISRPRCAPSLSATTSMTRRSVSLTTLWISQFGGWHGARPYNPTKLGKEFSAFCRMNGFNCTFNDLRHTFATMMIAQGTDIRTVADWLGHASPSMTLDVYADVAPEAKRDSLDKMKACFDVDMDGVFGDLDPKRDEPPASSVAGSLGMTRSDYLRSLVRKDLASA